MDESVVEALNGLAYRHDWLGDILELYAKLSEPLFAALVVALLVAGLRTMWARQAAVLAGASAAIALALAWVVAHLADRPRPFVAHPASVHLLVAHAADPGLPSDHATAAFAIATALWCYRRWLGVAALAAAVLLAADRVAIGVHYPSDVLAGALLGVLTSLALARVLPGWLRGLSGHWTR